MPKLKQPGGLKSLCLNNIYQNMETYWIPKDNELKHLMESSKFPSYFLGPFEDLSDNDVHSLLKMIYQTTKMNNVHLIYFLHNHLRSIDFSYIRKSSLLNNNICRYMGKNCFKLTRLNLCYQKHLTPKNICDILYSMHSLKHLNLGHTQANYQVAQQISVSCTKLTSLSLENCMKIYDDNLEEIVGALAPTLEVLNVDNINLADATIKEILEKCVHLRVFNVCNLVQVLYNLYQNYNEVDEWCEVTRIEAIEISSSVNLKSEMMEALALICPKLKSLTAYCYADKYVLQELCLFNNLCHLVLGNNTSLITFKFEGYFLEWLKKSFGKHLKSLELISVPDVNLKSICLYCNKLSKLKIEIFGDYDPAADSFLDENNNEIIVEPNTRLTDLSIHRVHNKYEQVPQMNIATLKNHISLLLGGGSVKKLSLNGLQELDDEFFIGMFSTPILESFVDENKMIWQHVHHLELRHLCGISAGFIENYLLQSSANVLEFINLEGCKSISKKEYLSLVKFVNNVNLNCQIKWL